MYGGTIACNGPLILKETAGSPGAWVMRGAWRFISSLQAPYVQFVHVQEVVTLRDRDLPSRAKTNGGQPAWYHPLHSPAQVPLHVWQGAERVLRWQDVSGVPQKTPT
jgi:hypothetical protein